VGKLKNLGDEGGIGEAFQFLFPARGSWMEIGWLVLVTFAYVFFISWFLSL